MSLADKSPVRRRGLRIMEVITTLGVGGAEMHLLSLTRGLLARGHAPEVFYLKGRGELAQDFLRSGIPVQKISMEGAGEAARAIYRLSSVMRRSKPDLIHTHLLKADAVGAVASFFAGRSGRLVSSKHNDERALLHPVFGRVHGMLSSLDRAVIVLSDHVGGFVAEHGRVSPRKIRRVYYGLDPARFENASADGLREELRIGADEFVITCVARFAPQKAHTVLLDALSKTLQSVPRARLLLVGDDPFGDYRKRAEEHARSLRLNERALFLGIRRDVPRILAASDLFTMSSLWEGLGLVFLEAMAARLPVVATNVSAVPEVVPHGRCGLLVPPNDADVMARAFVNIAKRPDRGRSMGDAGRVWVRERFGIDRMVDETLAILESVVAEA
ncbi:MAG: glycosyltransferase [Planctomycetes bacterium]|nr:glycosyltransferase [Planctomycetota bacterium]